MTTLSTARAAAQVGMSPASFRKAMARERVRGLDLRAPRESWPDARTPLWDAAGLAVWDQTRRRRTDERKQ